MEKERVREGSTAATAGGLEIRGELGINQQRRSSSFKRGVVIVRWLREINRQRELKRRVGEHREGKGSPGDGNTEQQRDGEE